MTRATPSPSRLLCEATGVEPDGEPADHAGTCRLCGSAYNPGDLIAPHAPGASFNDGADILEGVGDHMCGYCVPWMDAKMMTQMQGVLVSGGEAWRVTKDGHIRWALDNGLTPPALIAKATRKREHLIWRTPIILSNERIVMRVGRDTLSIDRARLDHYEQAARAHMDALLGNVQADKRLYAMGQRLFKAPNAMGRNERAWYDALPDDLREAYESLTFGEVWAAQRLLTADPVEPERFVFDRHHIPLSA